VGCFYNSKTEHKSLLIVLVNSKNSGINVVHLQQVKAGIMKIDRNYMTQR